MAASLGITVLVVLPNLLWIKNHRDLALASVYKFGMDSAGGWHAVAKGLKTWILTAIDQLAVLVAILALIFWKAIRARMVQLPSANEKLLLRMFLATGGIIVIGICAFGV